MSWRTYLAPALLIGPVMFGCGHSEEEWQQQLDKYNHLDTDLQSTKAKLAEAQAKVDTLSKELKDMGLDLDSKKGEVSKLSASLEEQERALTEYKARARQLEAIKARFDALRRKLDDLTKLGLAVSIRHNRMVISLPGDVLFDSGRDTLKKDGEAILAKVGTVIHNDGTLLSRDYQVAGHTDNKPLQGGVFKDNWGLSLMRARSVLQFLVGGGLPKEHWSAAGFADTDPVATNESDDGRQKNRRCDLIVVPSVEEMLDLKAIAQ